MQGPQNPVHCLLTLTTAVGRGKEWLHMKLLDIQCPVQREGRLSYHISGWSTSGWSNQDGVHHDGAQHAKLCEPVWSSGKALGW